eukprot:m.230614 g.230614  ORF g.230614 m.230614 type:complete len:406 (+) comp18099_c0_seq1:72-1289(+)
MATMATVKALYPYAAQNSGEVTLEVGELYTVLDTSDASWWRVKSAEGSEGYAPSNYLEAVATPAPAPISSAATGSCRCTHAYAATKPDELSMQPGDVISIKQREDGWWFGTNGSGATGWFPASYVEEIQGTAAAAAAKPGPKARPLSVAKAAPAKPPAPAAPSSGLKPAKTGPAPAPAPAPAPVAAAPRGGAIPPRAGAIPARPKPPAAAVGTGRVAKALFDYTPGDPQDAGLVVGEMMDIVDSSEAEWWRVRVHRTGITGLVPATYIEEIVAFDYAKMAVGTPGEAPLFTGPTPPWYHGRVPREVCEALIIKFGSRGSFLVRQSDRTVTDYSVSVHTGSGVRHFKITRNGATWQFGERSFPSVSELVEYYARTTPIFTTADGVPLHLTSHLSTDGAKGDYVTSW